MAASGDADETDLGFGKHFLNGYIVSMVNNESFY